MEEMNAKALEYAGGDRYLLSVATGKRVEELFKGAKPLIDVDVKNFYFIYKSILAENSDNISYNLSKILKRKVRKIFSQTVHSNNTKTNLYSRYISLGVIKCTTIFKLYLQI